MHILQLTSGYAQQKLYKNLISKLQTLGISQEVYVPVRTTAELGKNNLPESPDLKIYYSFILRCYHRLLFNLKIKNVYFDLKKKIDVNIVSATHAHFLFSDGAVALRLKKEHNIPFLITIRNTDVNYFFKYAIHLRGLGLEIMCAAQQIIFLTPSYVHQVIDNYVPDNLREDLLRKISIVPNGVDDFWLQHRTQKLKISSDTIKLIYVGDFTKNKNVLSVIYAAKEIVKENIQISLTIVGGGGNGEKEVLKEIKKKGNLSINFVGRAEDKETLLKHYRSNDILIMPSFKETFGLVYLEAMSQGLPIIFTKGQGVDGYFDIDSPGYAVNPISIQDIKDKILEANKNLTQLSQNALKHIKTFSWENAALNHKLLYKKTINK